MGMSTHVVGLIPVDEKWIQMKKIWDLCREAKVPVPEEVCSFFGEGGPDDGGQLVHVEEIRGCVKEYRGDESSGLEVDLKKLPSDVKVLRFYNSY